MDKQKLTFSNYIAPATFIFFIVLVVSTFAENIMYFKKSLQTAFVEQQVPKNISIDNDILRSIAKKININTESIPLLIKEQP